MNLVLVVSDTLRQDHLPCYGNRRVIAPHLSALAQQAVVFDRCSAASFPTVPARADIMTGRFTFTYLDWGPLPQDEVTLAQCLSAAGYLTFGVADTPFLLRNGYGLDRGFADFEWVKGQRGGVEHDDVVRRRRGEADHFAPTTFRVAADWLEHHRRDQFFLYIDTWDPHEPWDPPDYYVKPYLPDYAGEQVNPSYWDWRADGLSDRDLAIAHACYCGEITMVDHWFGFLMQRLERFGLLENTAVIFTSDHGFYFGERGQFGKRRFRWPGGFGLDEGFARGLTLPQGQIFRSPLHNEITRVPLLAYVPGVRAGRTSALCSLPDLMPTLLQLAGAPVPARVQSASLAPVFSGGRADGTDLVITSAPFEEAGRVSRTVDDLGRQAVEVSPSTITDGEWDLLYAIEGEPYELYRSREDPEHQTDLAAERRDVAESLRSRFVTWLQRQGAAERLIAPRLRL